jgi:hypothetical protein
VSRILKVAVGVIATALVVGGAVVVYRETDLMTGSLVLLAGLMIAALLARRAAVREERVGMADWENETLASAEAAEDLFGEWSVSSPRHKPARQEPPAMTPAPSVAPPVPAQSTGPASPMPVGAEVPEPADPSVAVSRPLRDESDEPQDTESLVASLFVTNDRPASFEPLAEDPDPFGVDQFISAPPERAFAGAGAPVLDDHRSPIDWTGQGGRVDERVTSSDDILRVSEATALPLAADTGGSELARLLSKVEARLRDYD